MIPSDWQEVARAIHGSGRQMVIAVTGGGTGALAALLQTPGASRSILEAVVPYSLAALIDWIGGKPDQACSDATARAMAMAAFMRSRELAPEVDVEKLIGVGCTASLATDRPKRGARRVHLAIQQFDATYVANYSLSHLHAGRAEDEQATAELILSRVAATCRVDALAIGPPDSVGNGVVAPDEQAQVLLGQRSCTVLRAGSDNDYFDEADIPAIRLLFPGAFNPQHAGHVRMAEIAERKIGATATWELSITNVDKPPLDYMTIDERVEALRLAAPDRLIALTRASTFREKAELFPGATFIVGADTVLRIADPRYYGGDVAKRDQAITAIGGRGCRFLVFGRELDGRFTTLDDLNVPESLRRLCDGVPATEFREDVSSTELRQGGDI
ncbi:MAG TPA: hypothetical protein VF175_10350 [Lacipirellula sp.]